jgi:hypothetical protein
MTIETLNNLPLIQNQTAPISAEVYNYYINTFAGGSGPNGTYLITDFFGTASGTVANNVLPGVTTILLARIADTTLSNLAAIYANMLGCVDGTFGDPVAGPVTIPSGPGAGTYADAETAMATLIPLAQTAIVTAAAAMGSDTSTLNTAFDSMAAQSTQEATNQTKASINFDDLVAGDQLSVMSLISSIPGFGTETAMGQAAQFFEEIADTSTQAGQSIVGAMRQGRNDVQLNSVGITGYGTVPDLPETPPPQASLLSSGYTVTQARADSVT